MCIATSFNTCSNTNGSQYQTANIKARFHEEVPRMADNEMKITSVQTNITAPVAFIGREHGFIDYVMSNEVIQASISKNGARCLPENNGKVFFHETEVSGPLTDLKVGDLVEFNLVHIKTNNRIIANGVALPKDVEEPMQICDEQANQLAHFQRMQLPKTYTTVEQPKIVHVRDFVIGTLVEVNRIGQGHAFLEAKAFPDEKILLMFNQLIGTDVSIMKAGDNFRFRLFKNNHNGRLIARYCEYLRPGQLLNASSSSAHSIATLGHFQFMEAPKVSKAMEMPKFTPMLQSVTGCVHSVMMSQRCGFLTVDSKFSSAALNITSDTKIFFHEKDMVGMVLSTVKPSERVLFEISKNNQNGKYVAKSIQQSPLADEMSPLSKATASMDTGIALDKAIWKNMSAGKFELPVNSYGSPSAGKGAKAYTHKKLSLLVNESDKRRRSMDTLNKISASSARSAGNR